MTTPACIGLEYPDRTVKVVYLSSDGDPSWAGNMLFRYWNTQEKVEQLLSEGDLYRLGQELGEAHDFIQAQNHPEHYPKRSLWCAFKMRDYDRRNTRPLGTAQTFTIRETLLVLNEVQDTPWTYLFRSGSWYVYAANQPDGLKLTEEYLLRITSDDTRK